MSGRRSRNAKTARAGSAAARPRVRWRDVLIAVGLVLAIFIAYSRTLRGGFIWDDDFYVSANATLRSLAGLRQIWFQVGATPQYYPLVFTSFWAEYHLFGANPIPYHVANVLLHALSAILVWRIGRRLSIPGALAAAFLFGLHPVHVESVAWITERKNVLSGFFYLASMLTFLYYRPPRERAGAPAAWYALSLLLFLAALFSKTVTATLPAALVLIYWWKTGRFERRHILPVLPMLLIGALAGSLTTWVEKHHVGTEQIDWHLSLVDRTLIASRAVWFYLGKLFWPSQLTFIYPRWRIDSHDLVSYLFPLTALATLGALFALRSFWGRGPLVTMLFFVGTLFPALGFVDVFPMRFSFVADHFQYLASLGPIVLVAAIAASRLSRPIPLVPVGLVTALLLGVLTYRQGSIYESSEKLWRDTLAKNPRASIALINLGAILQKSGRLEEAERCYQGALDDPECLDRADVLRNLGLAAAGRKDTSAAIRYYERAIAERPAFATAHVNLGELLRGMGKLPEAAAEFERAVGSDPNDAVARNNLGSALFDMNRLNEAVTEFQAAVALKPDLADAHYNLGNALAKLKRNEEAQSAYLRALQIRPDHVMAHTNLANLLLQIGRDDDAIAHLQTALLIDPQYPLAHYALAYALDRRGLHAEAAEHYRRARMARPDLVPPSDFKTP